MRNSCVFAAVVGLTSCVAAHADTVTDLIQVNASGNGQTVSLAYQLTWDPTQNTFSPTPSGVTLLSVTNNDPAYAAAFQVAPEWQFFYEPFGSLEIGGANPSYGGGLGTSFGVDDYLLDLSFSNGIPTFVSLSESNADGISQLNEGTVTLTPPFSAGGGTGVTPEPSGLALLGTGLIGLAGVARRRWR